MTDRSKAVLNSCSIFINTFLLCQLSSHQLFLTNKRFEQQLGGCPLLQIRGYAVELAILAIYTFFKLCRAKKKEEQSVWNKFCLPDDVKLVFYISIDPTKIGGFQPLCFIIFLKIQRKIENLCTPGTRLKADSKRL